MKPFEVLAVQCLSMSPVPGDRQRWDVLLGVSLMGTPFSCANALGQMCRVLGAGSRLQGTFPSEGRH